MSQTETIVAEVVSPREAARPEPLVGRPSFRRKYHLSLLLVSLMVLAAAALLSVGGGGVNVTLPTLGPLPELCTYKRWTGANCPGCGLTRCFIALAHGDLASAWGFNPAGLLVFGVVIAQVPYRGWQFGRLATGRTDYRMNPWAINAIIWTCVVALLVQWLVRFWW